MGLVEELHRARRILCYGASGSGKTTLARSIARLKGLPLHLMDTEVGWVAASDKPWHIRPEPEQVPLALAITAQQEWVVDAAYGAWEEPVKDRADIVIALDYPMWVSLWRLTRRTWRRIRSGTTVCNGNRESWRMVFSKDSFFLWHLYSFFTIRATIRKWASDPSGTPVIRVRDPRQVRAVLREVAFQPPVRNQPDQGNGDIANDRRD